ncbi:50S ribosomal protein L9 [candidate division TA06 bacterium]|uniref:Large ribosomal subunit protein bL9 n=1 Tax=candidate division TA06 bacterium TaxID=2250710 RepID=A0A660SE42_UNCT6|nr:MAG: 50S ribosomal protein L9 [candidate division TA06 bacterium]
MEIILLKDVEKMGKIGDVVKVKDGFARNYLIPEGIAIIDNESNKKRVKHLVSSANKKVYKAKEDAEGLSEELSKLSLTISVKAGEEDKLYGSVTNSDIEKLLKKEGYEIDHKMIIIEEPIKKLGVYDIRIKLHSEVYGAVKLWVVKE